MYKINQRIPLRGKRHTKKAMSGGFTLVELIVLCVILAIMAAVMVPALTGYIDRAKEKECAVNRKAILLQLESARVKKPETAMGDMLGGSIGVQDIKCPSGGVYQAIGDNTVECSIHGQDSTVSGKGHGNESIEGNPDRPGTIDTESEQSQTESQSQTVKPTEPPVTDPPEPDTPETESATEETESEPEEKTLVDELTDIGGSYESLWDYAMDKSHGNYVNGLTIGNVFKDKNGDFVIVNGSGFGPDGLKAYDAINKIPNGNFQSTLLVINTKNIMDEEAYAEAKKNKSIKKSDVVKYGDTFYVAQRDNPGEITTTGWLDGWIKVVEMTDDRFESAGSDKN